MVQIVKNHDWYFIILGIVGGIGICTAGDALFGVLSDMNTVLGGALLVGLYWGLVYYSDYFIPKFEKICEGLK
jgi:hypothetical protein